MCGYQLAEGPTSAAELLSQSRARRRWRRLRPLPGRSGTRWRSPAGACRGGCDRDPWGRDCRGWALGRQGSDLSELLGGLAQDTNWSPMEPLPDPRRMLQWRVSRGGTLSA